MIGFLILSLALVAMVFWLIAPALLGKRSSVSTDQRQQNILIAKERLAELETQYQQNEISEAEYSVAKTEIEFALLEDTKQDDAELADSNRAAGSKLIQRVTYLVLSAIPFAALLLYQLWGTPDAIIAMTNPATANTQSPHQAQGASHDGDINKMLASLEAKLTENPNNPNGWYTLGRSYMVQKQYDKALNAFQQLHKLVGDDPNVLVVLADAMTMASGGDIRGEPFKLAQQALQLAPENTTALWLTGLGYQADGDLHTAITHWQKLLTLLADDPKSAEEVQALIANAQEQLGSEPGSAPIAKTEAPVPTSNTATAKLTVDVSLDATLKQKLSGDDFVMIYAQRVQGLKMPLAMARVQVKDLPIKVELSDANALSPMNKLSGEQEVNVIARISKSGQATKQPDDMEIKSGPYKITHQDVINLNLK